MMNLSAQGRTKEKRTMGNKNSSVLTAGRVFTLNMLARIKILMKQTLSLRGITSIFRRRDHQDREPQHEKGHALMASTSKSKALLIDSGASNHMMAEKDSFSSFETIKSIPIHMGDDSTIISEGQGTVDLENGFFSNVLYVPSLAENILSVYQMTHTRVPKRVSFSPNAVEIMELAS